MLIYNILILIFKRENIETIEIIKPDDWHVHFRDNEILKALFLKLQDILVEHCMPNLVLHILQVKMLLI